MSDKKFLTIRAAAEECSISQGALRRMVRQNMVAGFYSGNRFNVNVPALREQLDSMSAEHGEVRI